MVKEDTLKLVAVPLQVGDGVVAHREQKEYVKDKIDDFH
jgi:hypothetical protein